MVYGVETEIVLFEGGADPMVDIPILEDTAALGFDLLAIRVEPNRIVIDTGRAGFRRMQERGQVRHKETDGGARACHVP